MADLRISVLRTITVLVPDRTNTASPNLGALTRVVAAASNPHMDPISQLCPNSIILITKCFTRMHQGLRM